MSQMRIGLALSLAGVVACEALSPTPSRLTKVTIPLCISNLDTRPFFFAYRNEGDDWVALPANFTTDTFAFEATKRFEIAFGGTNTFVARLTVDDLKALDCQSAASVAGPRHYYSVSGLGAGESMRMYVGTGTFGNPIRPRTNPFDAIATAVNGPSSLAPARAAIVRRSLSFPDSSTMPAFDFASAEASLLDSIPITIEAPTAGEAREVSLTVRTPNGTIADLATRVPSAAASLKVPRLAASQSIAGDTYIINVGYGAGSATRSLEAWVDNPNSKTLVAGPVSAPLIATRTVIDNGGPSTLAAFSGTVAADELLGGSIIVVYRYDFQSSHTRMVALTSAGYRNGASVWEVGIPDLTKFDASQLPNSVLGWGLEASSQSLADRISDMYKEKTAFVGRFGFPQRPVGTVIRRSGRSGALP